MTPVPQSRADKIFGAPDYLDMIDGWRELDWPSGPSQRPPMGWPVILVCSAVGVAFWSAVGYLAVQAYVALDHLL